MNLYLIKNVVFYFSKKKKYFFSRCLYTQQRAKTLKFKAGIVPNLRDRTWRQQSDGTDHWLISARRLLTLGITHSSWSSFTNLLPYRFWALEVKNMMTNHVLHSYCIFIGWICWYFSCGSILQYKIARNGGELVRMNILVGDETRSYFPVTIWQRHMSSQILAGHIFLLQSMLFYVFVMIFYFLLLSWLWWISGW